MKKLILAAAVIFTIALSAFAKVSVQSATTSVAMADKANQDKIDFVAQAPLSGPKSNLSQADVN